MNASQSVCWVGGSQEINPDTKTDFLWVLMPFFFAFACLLRALSKTPSSLALNQTQHCKQLEGLVVSQVQLCRSNLELMQTIIQAAREVIKTCRKTFSDMRWNCSSIELAPNYLLDLERGKQHCCFGWGAEVGALVPRGLFQPQLFCVSMVPPHASKADRTTADKMHNPM